MAMLTQFTVTSEYEGERLDIFLAKKMDMSRSQIKKRIMRDLVRINDVLPKKSGDQLKVGDVITIHPEKTPVATKQEIKEEKQLYDLIRIMDETDDYVVIDKPTGLLVHQTEAEEPVTLAHWVLMTYPK